MLIALFGQTVNAQWLTTGNVGGGLKLGLTDNNPLRVYTSNIQRMHINESGTFYGSTNAPTGGFIGIGEDPTDIRSRLTITGTNNTGGFIGNGYREWMKTGVFNLENSDNMYVGMKEEGINRSDAVIAFGDDDQGSEYNNFRILYADNGYPDDGHLELARYTSTGNIGFGPVFTNAAQPQSLLHLNRSGNSATWLQMTNESGTAQTANDGFRLGTGSGGAAYLRQQENRPLIFQTDWDNTAGGIADGERMRITSIGAPGVDHDPAGAPDNNITRVAISHDGDNPITDPVSLLHLGNDVGSLFASDDGWRDWMDVGIFINKTNDNIYVGLKKEEGASPFDDRYDAVVSWGDNQDPVSPLEVGPDNLRFIFTSTLDIGAGDPVSTSNNGLEVARMEPGLASTLPGSNYGMMGIGNFAPGSPNDVNGTPVDAKLDIDGDLRIREVTEDTSLNLVLVIDTTDLGRVHWRAIDDLGGGVGNYCPDPQNPLTDNFEVPLDSNNYYFTGSQPYPGTGFNTNGVGMGVPCNTDLWGKLHVVQDEVSFLNQGAPISLTAYFDNVDDNALVGIGVASFSQGVKENQNTAGYFEASNATKDNFGIQGVASGTANNNRGGYFNATDAIICYGVYTEASGGGTNYGIYARAGVPLTGGPDFAGYFDGDVTTTGGYYTVSDENLKEHVEPIVSASEQLSQLNPVTYDFRYQEYASMNLPVTHQIGLIAQEVEQVLPELVTDVVHPAEHDSLGNEISPQIALKGVNYMQLIPLLVAGFKEQQSALAAKDQQLAELTERLAALEDCIERSHLCSGLEQKRMEDSGEADLAIELNNVRAIILDQNLPNPFAEQTTITYLIPEEVNKAELIFYDMSGRIIKQVQINERGSGKMTVYGSNLKNGVYTYSLIADGELIATKKMVKQ